MCSWYRAPSTSDVPENRNAIDAGALAVGSPTDRSSTPRVTRPVESMISTVAPLIGMPPALTIGSDASNVVSGMSDRAGERPLEQDDLIRRARVQHAVHDDARRRLRNVDRAELAGAGDARATSEHQRTRAATARNESRHRPTEGEGTARSPDASAGSSV